MIGTESAKLQQTTAYFSKIMGIINKIREMEPEMFEYLPAKEIFPHDNLMRLTVLRLIPARLTPNKITLFRIIFTPAVIFLITFGHLYTGVIAFLLVAFTDVIDGSLARTKNMVTRFGMLFDPLADKLLIGSMVLLLVFNYYPFWLGMTIIAIEIIFIIFALVAKYKFKTVRMANIWGKVKMILQVLAVFITLLALLLELPVLFNVAMWVFGAAIGLAIVSLFSHGV
jgi:CDP-diacylglycerol--glycerol-3-phosphate 3-phosphatidyltransferase